MTNKHSPTGNVSTLTPEQFVAKLVDGLAWQKKKLIEGDQANAALRKEVERLQPKSDLVAPSPTPFCVAIHFHICYRDYSNSESSPYCYDSTATVNVMATDQVDAAQQADSLANNSSDQRFPNADYVDWDIGVAAPGRC